MNTIKELIKGFVQIRSVEFKIVWLFLFFCWLGTFILFIWVLCGGIGNFRM